MKLISCSLHSDKGVISPKYADWPLPIQKRSILTFSNFFLNTPKFTLKNIKIISRDSFRLEMSFSAHSWFLFQNWKITFSRSRGWGNALPDATTDLLMCKQFIIWTLPCRKFIRSGRGCESSLRLILFCINSASIFFTQSIHQKIWTSNSSKHIQLFTPSGNLTQIQPNECTPCIFLDSWGN